MNIFLKIVIVLGIGLSIVVFALGLIFISILLLRRLGFIPECYKLVDYNRENICLRSRGKKRVIKWREINSICSYSLSSGSKRKTSGPIELELKNGEAYTLGWLSGDITSLRGRFYDIFLENLKLEVDDIKQLKFSHPPSWIRFKNKAFRQSRVWFVLFGLLWVALWIGIVIYSHGAVLGIARTYFFALFIPILCLIVFFRARRLGREHKGLLSLEVNGDDLSFEAEFGKLQTRCISDVIDWDLDKTKGVLVFSDDTKLNDLEKLRYWPILREYLLSKLEPSEEE